MDKKKECLTGKFDPAEVRSWVLMCQGVAFGPKGEEGRAPGLPRGPRPGSKPSPCDAHADEIKRRYRDGESRNAIARALGFAPSTVGEWLRANRVGSVCDRRARVIKWRLEAGVSQEKIAKEIGVHVNTLRPWIHKNLRGEVQS